MYHERDGTPSAAVAAQVDVDAVGVTSGKSDLTASDRQQQSTTLVTTCRGDRLASDAT